MPLIKSATEAARKKNTAEMIRAGHRPDVAAAASHDNQRRMRAKNRKKHRSARTSVKVS